MLEDVEVEVGFFENVARLYNLEFRPDDFWICFCQDLVCVMRSATFWARTF
jgi:hypothetical protein